MADLGSVTDADFQAEVLQAEQPVLVDFWAEWCGPCKVMAPVLEKLAAELQGQLKVVTLDVQANPNTPVSLGVMNIPTLILFRGGVELKRFGAMPAKKLAQQLQETLGSRSSAIARGPANRQGLFCWTAAMGRRAAFSRTAAASALRPRTTPPSWRESAAGCTPRPSAGPSSRRGRSSRGRRSSEPRTASSCTLIIARYERCQLRGQLAHDAGWMPLPSTRQGTSTQQPWGRLVISPVLGTLP